MKRLRHAIAWPQILCISAALLVVSQIITGGMSLWGIVQHEKNIKVPPIPIQSQATSSAAVNTPFFGEYLPKSLGDMNVKQSLLNLTIVGIIFSPNEGDSQAIIRSLSGEQNAYHVGDELPGGVIIKRITPDGVLVGHKGVLESLSFPKNELLFEPLPSPLMRE